jgi:hypothetical protein
LLQEEVQRIEYMDMDGSMCARASTSKSNKHSNYVDIVPGMSAAVEVQLTQTIVEQQPTNNCILACENKIIFAFAWNKNLNCCATKKKRKF